MIKTLFNEEKDNFPNISSLNFDEKSRFSAKISFNNNKTDGFSIEIHKNNLFWPNSLTISLIKNFYLSKNNQNTLKILEFSTKNQLNLTIYRLNSTIQRLFSSKGEKSKRFLNYTSFFSKNITGKGLHQQANIVFSLEGDISQFSNEIYKGKCSVLIVDFLDDTDYIDIEEMIDDPSYVIYHKNP